ncbi:MAG: hypothetical protein ACRD2D_03830 [Terriglobales bacterium]
MPPLRLAVPGCLEGAFASVSDPEWRWVRAPQTPDSRQQERWQRLWLEVRRSHGDDALAATHALADPTLRTALFALDRQADAVVLPPDESGASAWGLLQPRSARPCADLYWASLPGQGEFGWMPWPTTAPAAAADTVQTAASLTGARPIWVNFRASEGRVATAWTAAQALLAARLPIVTLGLYSPLFFGDGRLLATPLLEKILTQIRGAAPLVLIPGLNTQELAAAVRAASGAWVGPLRLGAEIPAARLATDVRPPEVRLALALMARLART